MTANDKDRVNSHVPRATAGADPSPNQPPTNPGLAARRLLLDAAGIALREARTLRGLGGSIDRAGLGPATLRGAFTAPSEPPPLPPTAAAQSQPKPKDQSSAVRVLPLITLWQPGSAARELLASVMVTSSGVPRADNTAAAKPAAVTVKTAARAKTPWLYVLTTVFAVALVTTAYQLTVSTHARGVLRNAAGKRTIATSMSGTVTATFVHPGDKVAAGQLLLALDTSAARTELQQTLQNMQHAETQLRVLQSKQPTYERGLSLLRADAQLTQRRLQHEAEALQLAVRQRTLERERIHAAALGSLGVVQVAPGALDEEVRTIQHVRLTLEQELTRTQFQQVLFERDRLEQLQRARAELEAAQAKELYLQDVLVRAELRAPVAGRIDKMNVTVGEQVQAGQALASSLSLGAPTQAIVFADVRDREFLRVGSVVHLTADLRQLTAASAVAGTVSAVSPYLATPHEVQATVGAEVCAAACLRVEIALAETADNRAKIERLTTGDLVTARFEAPALRSMREWFQPLSALIGG